MSFSGDRRTSHPQSLRSAASAPIVPTRDASPPTHPARVALALAGEHHGLADLRRSARGGLADADPDLLPVAGFGTSLPEDRRHRGLNRSLHMMFNGVSTLLMFLTLGAAGTQASPTCSRPDPAASQGGRDTRLDFLFSCDTLTTLSTFCYILLPNDSDDGSFSRVLDRASALVILHGTFDRELLDQRREPSDTLGDMSRTILVRASYCFPA